MHTKSLFSLASDDTDFSRLQRRPSGQGHTQVTPLHMAMIASAIANGGNLMEPYMVDGIETAGGGRRVKSIFLNPSDRFFLRRKRRFWDGVDPLLITGRRPPFGLWIFCRRKNRNRRGQRPRR